MTTPNSTTKLAIPNNYYGFIYLTTNNINKHNYVGKHHGKITDSYMGSGKLISKAFLKYGPSNFTREILEFCSDSESLNRAEIKWIDFYRKLNQAYYNISNGGDGGNIFSNLPDKEKERIRKICGNTQRGVIWSEERKQKSREKMLGRVASEETKRILSEKSRLLRHTDEEKRLIAEAARGRKFVTNGKENKFVKGKELEFYLLNGYHYGRTKLNAS